MSCVDCISLKQPLEYLSEFLPPKIKMLPTRVLVNMYDVKGIFILMKIHWMREERRS